MKNIKKLLALVLALAICAAFALPALAEGEETGYTLTMNNAQPGHKYVLYQVLKGTVLPGSDNIPTGTLGNIEWGDNYSDETTSVADYAKKLSGLTGAGQLNEEIERIKSSFTASTFDTPKINDDGAIVWENLPGGYYVVVDETDEDKLDDTNPRSHVMAQVVGDTTITPKAESLIPDKGVKEALDVEEEYQKIINSEVGRTLGYKVTATVSVGTMNLNENYWVSLVDKMTEGHTYVEDSAKLVVLTGDGTAELITTGLPDVEVVVNDDKTITMSVAKFDLKKLLTDAEVMPEIGNVIVQLTYQAVVNEDAIQFEVVENEVKWSTGVDENGEVMTEGTPIKTKTYIYHLSGEKISGGDEAALSGAEFTLERIFKDADGNIIEDKTESVKIFATETNGEYYAWNDGEGTLPENLTPVDDNVIIANGGDSKNTFNVKGLAEGWYRLTETKTPDGYNTMAALEIQIVPNTNDKGELTDGCTYNYGEVIKSDVVKVVNNKGTTLPSTGGMGTTILYIVGAVLVIGAGVVLFTKRRMSN